MLSISDEALREGCNCARDLFLLGRLHVSANTIKTRAQAIYRELDASSRTEAVATARGVGLLDA
jgi:hypothetical protein